MLKTPCAESASSLENVNLEDRMAGAADLNSSTAMASASDLLLENVSRKWRKAGF